MRQRHQIGFTPYIATFLLILFTAQALGARASVKDAQALIDDSASTLGRFLDDKGLDNFRENLRKAKGVVIVPRQVAAGLIVGGAGGKCTVLARYGDTNKWSQPWFCNLAAGSVGLQFGKDVSEVVLLIMTDKGMEAVMKSQTIFTGNQGDALVFVRQTEGAISGKPLTGSVLSPADDFNQAYYGKFVTARAVFERKEVYNRDGSKLVSLVTRNAKVRTRR